MYTTSLPYQYIPVKYIEYYKDTTKSLHYHKIDLFDWLLKHNLCLQITCKTETVVKTAVKRPYGNWWDRNIRRRREWYSPREEISVYYFEIHYNEPMKVNQNAIHLEYKSFETIEDGLTWLINDLQHARSTNHPSRYSPFHVLKGCETNREIPLEDRPNSYTQGKTLYFINQVKKNSQDRTPKFISSTKEYNLLAFKSIS